MNPRGEPIYKTRPTGPEAARFGRCSRLNDFISMSEGNSNAYLIETPDGNVLINAGMGLEAPVHHTNFRDLAGEIDGTIRYLAVTQGHVDHLGGVQYFRDRNPGLQMIAQANNQEHQAYDGRLARFRQARSAFRFADAFVKTFRLYADAGYTDINPQDQPTPDLVFEDRHELSVGGLDIVLIGQVGAETNDSLIVWLPQHRICFTGNLFGCPFGHFPNLVTIRGDRYRDALTCAEAAQTVLDLEPEVILYGHHSPVVGEDLCRREVTAIRDATRYVHDRVVKGMNEGTDLTTLQREIQLPAECEVGQGYGMVSWGVRAIWENYAGWFKHESTTELYSVPQKAIHADLLELAGADALVERARDKAGTGKREEALHLLDIVLSAAPDHENGRALAIEVHESLLADARTFCTTGNFWLEGWLEHQIKLLKGLSITFCVILALLVPTRAAEDRPVPVRVGRAAAAQSEGALRLTGTVTAEQRARLSPRVSGLVAKVHVDAGDPVESGDVLVDLDPTFAELAVQRAKATLEEARVRLAEAKRLQAEAAALLPQNFIPESEVLARAATVRLVAASVSRLGVEEREARELLKRHSVVAPFAGVVASKLTEAGEWVQTGDSLIDLVGTENLRFDVQVPQERFGDIEAKKPATIRLDGFAGGPITGEVAVKVPVNDPGARTFLVRIRLGDVGAFILPGMSGEAHFVLSGQAGAVIVPRDALVRAPDGTHLVWVVERDGDGFRATSHTVTVGRSLADRVEVVGGIAFGDAVVVRGNEALRENQFVRVIDED